MRHLILSTALALIPGLALADSLALVLGNERYEQLGRLSRGADVVRATGGIAALGFDVVALPNGRADTTALALAEFAQGLPDADWIIVALSGRFATDGTRTWLMTAEAGPPALLALAGQAVSVDSLLTVLARAPGRALLLLGADDRDTDPFDDYLVQGIGDLDIPQGVTVLVGAPRDVANFMAGELATPGGDLSALVDDNGNLTASGYLPEARVLLPRAAPPPPPPPPVLDTAAEDALWQGAAALDSVAAYRNYLARYPLGRFADQAETAIAAILAEPNRDARLTEEGINLSREQRRAIQRNLGVLDFDPRGIDGIFGSGTRRAIANWQQQNGFAQTSYLTLEQINRIDAQAARRAAELAAEAQRQQAEAARLDRAWWEETGASGDGPGLRAYLDRYPAGLFTELATDQLARIEAEERGQQEAQDRAAFDNAQAVGTVAAYRGYLQAWPRGIYQEQAEASITALTTPVVPIEPVPQEGDTARAQFVEQALNLNDQTRAVIEQRLDRLGLNPGRVDGVFDERTRRAIRRYQTERGTPVTGFLDERTMILMLAEAIGQ